MEEKKDIVGTFIILKAMSEMNIELLFTKSYSTKTRGLLLQLALGLKKREYFAQSVPTFWKWLLYVVVEADSISRYKKELD